MYLHGFGELKIRGLFVFSSRFGTYVTIKDGERKYQVRTIIIHISSLKKRKVLLFCQNDKV